MVNRILRSLLWVAATSLAPAAMSQSVHWDPPSGTLPVGQVSPLQLVFDDCAPDGQPATPKVDSLTIEYQGSSTNMSLVNGSFTRSTVISYAVLLANPAPATVDIPAFTVQTNKGKLTVAAAHFVAAGATVGNTGIPLNEAAAARLTPSSPSVWAGEVFNLGYSVDVAAGYYPTWGQGTFEWNPSPLVTEDWSQPEPFQTRGSEPRSGLSYHTRGIASTPGRLHLNTTNQLVNLSVGVTGFGFFQQRQYQQFAVASSPVVLEVRPLPAAPQDFSGAVGDFKVTSKLVPTQVHVGEPVTWTIELSGSGNWPAIKGLPAREVPTQFQAIQPKPKRTQPQGKLFDGSLEEDIVLIPTQEGTYELPALTFSYFDPKAGAYRTLTAPGGSIEVLAPAPATGAASQVTPAPGVPAVAPASLGADTKAPETPTATLGDPLAAAAPANGPMARRQVAFWAAPPLAVFLAAWAVLALSRAKSNDPHRSRRAARKELLSILDSIDRTPKSQLTGLLLSWQRQAAILLGLPGLAPSATTLEDPLWRQLWEESDRALYGTTTDLAADWAARARTAASQTSVPGFQPATLFLGRNLLPFLFLAMALVARAEDPVHTYRSGDFAGASKAWEKALGDNPLDWSARHNLSLALSQQDRWGEAVAHAAGAYLQNPRSPENRRQLIAAADKAGFVPEPFDRLLQPGPVEALARLESPADWQRSAIVSAWLLSGACVLALLGAYGVLSKRAAWILSGTIGACALLLAAASYVGHRAYGVTADSRVVVVWRAGLLRSVPCEADVGQKTSPLAAGVTAIADREFLGWVRLRLPNAESGWVSREEVIPLWGVPPKS